MKNIGIILAGGSGERFGNEIPKQYISFNGKLIIQYTIDTFINSKSFNEIVVVIDKKYKHFLNKNIKITNAGKFRQESVYNALSFIENNYDCSNVVITDACRPCITKETIKRGLSILPNYDGVVCACKSINTSCYVKNEKINQIINRTNQYELLMPQFFHFKSLLKAHKTIKNITNATDDSQLIIKCNPNNKIKILEIPLWEGLKLTYPGDYKIFELLLLGGENYDSTYFGR